MKELNTYLVNSQHDVYEDDYNEGELEQVNSYALDATIAAETPLEAIEKYFEWNLFYDFDIENAEVNDDTLYYSVLVDNENDQASEYDIQLWKEDQKPLYANHIVVTVSEIKKCKIL